MLHLLDETLAAFLREVVPLPARDVDIAFEAPDDASAAARSTRPSVNLHLWDVRPHPTEREPGEPDGRFRRAPLPRVECRYLVTAWAGAVREEHALLGGVLTALLLHPVIGPEHLRGGLASVRPLPELRLRGDGDFRTALGGRLKPGLDLVVTVTVEAAPRAAAVRPAERFLIRADEIAATPLPADNVGMPSPADLAALSSPVDLAALPSPVDVAAKSSPVDVASQSSAADNAGRLPGRRWSGRD